MWMAVYDTEAARRPVNVTLNSDLVARARAEGLNLSALAEEAVAAALARIARARFDAEIAQACRVHEQYLAEFGSLGDAVRANADADEPT
jgi:antitoxin CcdA